MDPFGYFAPAENARVAAREAINNRGPDEYRDYRIELQYVREYLRTYYRAPYSLDNVEEAVAALFRGDADAQQLYPAVATVLREEPRTVARESVGSNFVAPITIDLTAEETL